MASRKRRSAVVEERYQPVPVSKRARFGEDSGTGNVNTREAPGSDDGTEMTDRPSTISRTISPAPSFPFTEPSIADTSMTSASMSKRPKKYLCGYEDCGKAFDRPVRLQMHIRSHTNERPYACEEEDCDKTFLRSEHLTRHVKDKHSEEKDYVCNHITSNADGSSAKCDKSFTTATRLRRHLAAHEAKEETRCQEPGCGKMFRKQETLQRHIKQDHLHEKAYSCDHIDVDAEGRAMQCVKSFSKPEQLKNHKSREHAKNRYYCDVCSAAVEERVDIDMLEGDVTTPGLDASLVVFATYADLQHHMKIDHPPTCNDCGKQCASTRALKAHMDIEHTSLSERQQFPCTWPGCERAFTKTGNLKVHIQNVHTKARNFICGTFDLTESDKVIGWDFQGCGSAFGTKANLEDHVRTQHLGYPTKIKPCRMKKVKAEDTSETPSLMDVDEILTPSNDLSLLTGFGFQDPRNVLCLVPACEVRFARDSNLAQHLELTHGWHVDDINDAIAERDALSGGKFWIGGGEQLEAEEALRQQLTDAMMHTQPDHQAGQYPQNIANVEKQRMEAGGKWSQHMEGPVGFNVSSPVDQDDMIPVDPALMETTMSYQDAFGRGSDWGR